MFKKFNSPLQKSLHLSVALAFGSLSAVTFANAADAVVEQIKPPSVTVSAVTKRMMNERLVVNGSVKPVQEVAVGTDVAGLLVTELSADVGDVVKAGDVLARLDTSSLETLLAQNVAQQAQNAASVAQAEAQILDAQVGVKQAKDQYERAVSLAKSGVTTSASRDTATNGYDSAKAKLNTANQGLEAAKAQGGLVAAQRKEVELRISKAEVKAPADGLILARTAQLGAVVSGGAGPLFRIARDGKYEAVADVAENALPRIALDMPATLNLSGIDEPIKGKVRRVDPEIDAATRLGKVRVEIDADPRIRPGAFANIDIQIANREALSVPASGLVYASKDAFLQIVKGGVVETRKVKLGIRAGKYVEILEGAVAGEDVVERAGTFIANGDHVTAVPVVEETGALK